MFDNTITLTESDGTTTHTLNRVAPNGSDAEFYLNVSANKRIKLTINHEIPKSQVGESHLARVDVSHYDDDGVLLRTSSAWTVIKTLSGIQDDPSSEDAAALLQSFTTATNVVEKIVNREI